MLVVAILITLGYIISSEWSKRYKNNNPDPPPSNSSTPLSSDDEASSAPQPAPVSSDEPVIPQGSFTSLWMPYTVYEGKSIDSVKQWIADAKVNGYTAITVELKDETGIIHYKTSNTMASEYKAVSKDAVDLSPIVNAIKEAELVPFASISALKDKTAPSIARNNSYAYADQLDVNWWDNSAANGGKPWLNPYMENSRMYITDLTAEILNSGFSQVLLTNVMFPDKNTQKMNVITESMSREDILKKVVADATQPSVFSYSLSDPLTALETIKTTIAQFPDSIPFIRSNELGVLKPILDEQKIDSYVVY